MSQTAMQMSSESFLTMLRPISGDRAKITDIIRVLALMSPSQMKRMGEVIVTSPNRRELLIIKALKTQYPKLNIRYETSSNPHGRYSIVTVNPMEQLAVAAELIIQRGKGVEGIFRLTHSLDRPEELRTAIAAGRLVNMDGDHPLDLASMLKLYTRIGFPHLLTESDLADILQSRDCSRYLAALPADRRQYLHLLGHVCRVIDSHKEVTRMDLGNLARVFGPNFFQHNDPFVEMRLINPTIEATRLILAAA